MVLTSVISMLALRTVINGAVEAIEKKTGVPVKDTVEAAYSYLVDHFQDHSGRLTAALTGANERAWRTLEIALAGESLRTLLDRQEDKAFRAQIREALDANPLNEVVGDDADFRRACLAELRVARRKGLLTADGPMEPEALFRRASDFARFDDPAELLDAEWAALGQVAGLLRGDYPSLARLLSLRPSGGPSPLIVAGRYYFCRAVERDELLFRSVTWGTVDRIGQAQAQGFEALEGMGRQLGSLLDEVREIAQETHDDVLDIKAEQHRQGGQLGDLYRRVVEFLDVDTATAVSSGRATASSNEAGTSPKMDARAYFDGGYSHHSEGHVDQAILDYNQAIRLDPNYAVAYCNRGGALKSLSHLDRAINDYDQAIRLDPKCAFAYKSRGDAYKTKGDLVHANSDFDMAGRLWQRE